MSLRYSIVGRWEDNWYSALSPSAKILFDYLCDKCDDSGIIELNYELWTLQIGIDKKSIRSSLVELKKNLISDKKQKLWVKSHLFWQRQLPLDTTKKKGKWIYDRIKNIMPKFENPAEMQEILNNAVFEQQTVKSVVNRRRKAFVEPSYEEFEDEYMNQKSDADKKNIESLYLHYKTCGWVVGKNKPMSDWKAAIGKAILSDEKYNKTKKSRSQITIDVVNKLIKTEN